jgi:hypothetical protein
MPFAEDVLHRQNRDQRLRHGRFVHLSAGLEQLQHVAKGIDGEVIFVLKSRASVRSPAAEPPFSAGCMLVRPDDRSIGDDGFKIRIVCKMRSHTRLGPTPEALPYAVPFAEEQREVAPRSGSHHPHDRID